MENIRSSHMGKAMTDLPWLPQVLYGGPIEVRKSEEPEGRWWEKYFSEYRNIALEEAALVAEDCQGVPFGIAAAIRALKEKGE